MERLIYTEQYDPERIATDLSYLIGNGVRLGAIRERKYKTGIILIGKGYYEILLYKSLSHGGTELTRKRVYTELPNLRVKTEELT